MRWHLGKVPPTPGFDPESEDWLPMREPSEKVSLILAMVLALPLMVFWAWLWMALNGRAELNMVFSGSEGLLKVLLGLSVVAGGTLLHELLHALVMPGGWRSADTLIGFAGLVAFAHTFRPMTRRRFLLTLLTPLFVLTVLPILVDAALPGWRMPDSLAFLVALHGGACAGDVLGALLVLWSVPRGAIVRNQGWKTWYRLPEPQAGISPSPEARG